MIFLIYFRRWPDLRKTYEFTICHTLSSLKIDFKANFDDWPLDESFGMREFKVQASECGPQ